MGFPGFPEVIYSCGQANTVNLISHDRDLFGGKLTSDLNSAGQDTSKTTPDLNLPVW